MSQANLVGMAVQTYQAVALRDSADRTLYGAPVEDLLGLPMFLTRHLGRLMLVHYTTTDRATDLDRAGIKARYIGMPAMDSPDGQFHCVQPTVLLHQQLTALAAATSAPTAA